jgi:PAS domain S-box-containing protein
MTDPAEAAQRKISSFLSGLLRETPDLVAAAEPDGRLIFLNPAGRRILGVGADEDLAKLSLHDFHGGEASRLLSDAALPAAAERGSWSGETAVRDRGGREIPVDEVLLAHRRPDGAVDFLSLVARDVSEPRRAAEALRASEARYRAVVEDQTEAIARFLPDGTRLFVNGAYARFLGRSREELLGRNAFDFIVEEDQARIRQSIDRMTPADPTASGEHRVVRGDGARAWVEWTARGIFDASGALREVQTVGRDCTRRRLAEDELARRYEERGTELVRSRDQVVVLEEQARSRASLEKLVGRSAPMQEAYRRIRLAAQSEVTVLLTGESGTGQELAAAALHALSDRARKPFIAVNASAIPETLLESELFGHVKGAFTGATRDKTGVIPMAEGGTLFLDEVGDMSPLLQLKLLRVLEERQLRPVGSERPVKVDVRLVTATNRDLGALVAEAAFRQDFYYRIRVFEIRMPALRERTEDIPLLVDHFLRDLSKRGGRRIKGIEREALRRLMAHGWPGNVRELRNAVEHAWVAARGAAIAVGDLPPDVQKGAPPKSKGRRTRGPLTADRLRRLLGECGGNRAELARRLKMSRVTLWKRLKELGIEPAR